MVAVVSRAVTSPPRVERRFAWECAVNHRDIIAVQRLRYRIFTEDMGAGIRGGALGLDRDGFDAFSHHLVVRDTLSQEIVACTRILTSAQAHIAGSFYSNQAFDLHNILNLPGYGMEMGRTCVDARYSDGAVIAELWAGIAHFIHKHGFNYVFGCISVALRQGRARADAILSSLHRDHMAPEQLRVHPRLALPESLELPSRNWHMPPLLQSYIDQGACACGEPCWDPDLGVADILMLLRVETPIEPDAAVADTAQAPPDISRLP